MSNEGDARLRAILETAVEGIITINETGHIVTFNPAAERLFGVRARYAIGAAAEAYGLRADWESLDLALLAGSIEMRHLDLRPGCDTGGSNNDAPASTDRRKT